MNPRFALAVGVATALAAWSALAGDEKAPPRKVTGTGWKETVRERLEEPVSFDFAATPLKDALAALGDRIAVNVILDTSAPGIETKPVTLRVEEMKAGNTLNWILRIADLKYLLKDEAIFITTTGAAPAADELVLKFYDVQHLLWRLTDHVGPQGGAEVLDPEPGGAIPLPGSDEDVTFCPESSRDFFKQTVRADSWNVPGASLEIRNGLLVVSQTEEIHVEIEKLLKEISVKEETVGIEMETLWVEPARLKEILAMGGPAAAIATAEQIKAFEDSVGKGSARRCYWGRTACFNTQRTVLQAILGDQGSSRDPGAMGRCFILDIRPMLEKDKKSFMVELRLSAFEGVHPGGAGPADAEPKFNLESPDEGRKETGPTGRARRT